MSIASSHDEVCRDDEDGGMDCRASPPCPPSVPPRTISIALFRDPPSRHLSRNPGTAVAGGVPRLFPESALSDKEKAALTDSSTRIVFRVHDLHHTRRQANTTQEHYPTTTTPWHFLDQAAASAFFSSTKGRRTNHTRTPSHYEHPYVPTDSTPSGKGRRGVGHSAAATGVLPPGLVQRRGHRPALRLRDFGAPSPRRGRVVRPCHR